MWQWYFYKIHKKKFSKCITFGIDQNADNVKIAKTIENKIKVKNIVDLNYKNKFDVIVCSHVIQCLHSHEMSLVLKKFHKSLKKNGLLILSTLNSYKNFYEHPENVRPYPLSVFYRYLKKTSLSGLERNDNTSPFVSVPMFEIIKSKLRYEPLFYFSFDQNKYIFLISKFLNNLQYYLKIIKFWKYTSYTIVLKKK